VVASNNLPCSFESNKESVCDACQKGKSHQLPYPKSSSTSSYPLELVYSDVWGHAPESVEERDIMLALLIITVNVHGSICLSINLKPLRNFESFKHLLRDSLIEKFSLCKPIGVVNIKNFTPLKKSG
jgi:hypothetical protein